MAFTCPIDESNDRSGGADLQCHLCQSRLHSYRSLIEHFNRRHGVARSLMSKTYVYKKARRNKNNEHKKKHHFHVASMIEELLSFSAVRNF